MTTNDRGGKAALLTEILGKKRVEEMRQSGVLPETTADARDAASLAWHRNRLIEKFREKGLIPKDEAVKTGKQPISPTPVRKNHKTNPHPDFAPGAIGTRLAKHLNPERLEDEHPAVIAMFLRSQSATLRSEVLRSLPGSQARAVMRILRAGRPQAKETTSTPKADTRQKVDVPQKVEPEQKPQAEPVPIANDAPKMASLRRSAR